MSSLVTGLLRSRVNRLMGGKDESIWERALAKRLRRSLLGMMELWANHSSKCTNNYMTLTLHGLVWRQQMANQFPNYMKIYMDWGNERPNITFICASTYTSVGSVTLSWPMVPALATKGANKDAPAATRNCLRSLIWAFNAVFFDGVTTGANAAADERVARMMAQESFIGSVYGLWLQIA